MPATLMTVGGRASKVRLPSASAARGGGGDRRPPGKRGPVLAGSCPTTTMDPAVLGVERLGTYLLSSWQLRGINRAELHPIGLRGGPALAEVPALEIIPGRGKAELEVAAKLLDAAPDREPDVDAVGVPLLPLHERMAAPPFCASASPFAHPDRADRHLGTCPIGAGTAGGRACSIPEACSKAPMPLLPVADEVVPIVEVVSAWWQSICWRPPTAQDTGAT